MDPVGKNKKPANPSLSTKRSAQLLRQLAKKGGFFSDPFPFYPLVDGLYSPSHSSDQGSRLTPIVGDPRADSGARESQDGQTKEWAKESQGQR